MKEVPMGEFPLLSPPMDCSLDCPAQNVVEHNQNPSQLDPTQSKPFPNADHRSGKSANGNPAPGPQTILLIYCTMRTVEGRRASRQQVHQVKQEHLKLNLVISHLVMQAEGSTADAPQLSNAPRLACSCGLRELQLLNGAS